jgi:Tfp pilus assembly protein PilV
MVEVIVAMALLGISMMAVFGALRDCAVASHHSQMLLGSVTLAERLMVDAKLEQAPAFEEREGTSGKYSWRVRIVPTPVEGLGAIDVRVLWSEQGRAQDYELRSLLSMQTFTERRD